MTSCGAVDLCNEPARARECVAAEPDAIADRSAVDPAFVAIGGRARRKRMREPPQYFIAAALKQNRRLIQMFSLLRGR